MLNKYPGTCAICNNTVPANGGRLQKRGRIWLVTHLSCTAESGAGVHTFRTSGGTFYRNKRGRCEDAPCCGCCTI
jgi:hypothetical protein